jgi:uncharacterized protein DUF3592
MALTEAIINEIKVLIQENKKEEAESILVTEVGLSAEEAKTYIDRLSNALPTTGTANNVPPGTKKAAWVVVGVGLLLLGLAVYFFMEKNNQINNSYLTTGIVVGFIVHDGAAPIIKYEIDGTPYQYTSNVYAAPPAYDVNDAVEIYVLNSDPNEITINSFSHKWLGVTILGIFGSILELVGLLLFKITPSQNRGEISFIDTQRDRLNQFDD